VESGLFVCLRDGIEVFSRSISGLEFALRGVESSMLSVAIDEGKEGVERFAKELKEIVDAERERDESDAVLDEASFDRQTAESFLRVRSNEESEKDLEKSFLNFFEMVACRPKSVEDSIFPNGIWSFNGDLIHQIRNDYTNKLSNKIFKGTFRRAIAEQRIDLDYFTLGQPLFEAIYHSLHVEAVGRTYAIKIKRSDIDKNWSGFEYIFNPKPKTSNLGDNIGLQNRARQFFNFRTIHVFCDFNGLIANNSEELLTIRQSIKQQHKDKTWQNLTDKDKKNLDGPSQLNKDFFDWRTIVEHNFKIAKNHAYQNIRIIDSASSYIQPLLDLQNSISNWDLELDSIGYLSLNKSSN
jgi:ATP-dependent helicase HepA